MKDEEQSYLLQRNSIQSSHNIREELCYVWF